MRKLASFLVSATVIAALSPVGIGPAAGAPSPDPVPIPLGLNLRACDYSTHQQPFWGSMRTGRGEVVIRRDGNSVVAEIQFVNVSEPGMHYNVGLIQAPRASSAPCGPGAEGTAYTGMDLDPAGRATVTLRAPIQSGATGAWVKIDRPSPHSQTPEEFYSSVRIANI